MAVNGEPIDPGRLDASAGDVFAEVDAACADGRLPVMPTFFEVTTAIGLDVFRAAQVDVAVIEVGLGGRFDATNVIAPRRAAITSIAFDHERHLGTHAGADRRREGRHRQARRAAGGRARCRKRRWPWWNAWPVTWAHRSCRPSGRRTARGHRGRARVQPRTREWPDLEPL